MPCSTVPVFGCQGEKGSFPARKRNASPLSAVCLSAVCPCQSCFPRKGTQQTNPSATFLLEDVVQPRNQTTTQLDRAISTISTHSTSFAVPCSFVVSRQSHQVYIPQVYSVNLHETDTTVNRTRPHSSRSLVAFDQQAPLRTRNISRDLNFLRTNTNNILRRLPEHHCTQQDAITTSPARHHAPNHPRRGTAPALLHHSHDPFP